MINITIWSDFACPYCYIGETRLMNAINDLGIADKVNIEYRAYELDRNAPKEAGETTLERYSRKYRLSEKQAQTKIEDIAQLGQDLGIIFNYANSRYSNTHDAHRLMKLAEAKYSADVVDKLNFLLFDAYFTKNLVLADHDVLKKVAIEAGLDAKAVQQVLESDEYDDEVQIDEREASMHGVKGVPYMLFKGRQAVPGAISTEDYKQLLKELLEKETAPIKDEHPHSCGPKGCDLA